jgi:hypothetical protein
MTEVEWQTSDNPTNMLLFMKGKTSVRKLRLLACASCRRYWTLLTDDRSRKAVEVAEVFADGLATEEERLRVCRNCDVSLSGITAGTPLTWDVHARLAARATAYHDDAFRSGNASEALSHLRHAATATPSRSDNEQSKLIRDIFGNPFRTIVLEAAWLTSSVTDIARQIYTSRDFSSMPDLADALGKAGCDHEEILNHCRGPGPHVRGCWVVDRLLGMDSGSRERNLN